MESNNPLAIILAVTALIITAVLGLGRQFVVFTVMTRGLWIFRRYRRKLHIGLLIAAVPSALSLLLGGGAAVLLILLFALAFGVFGILFRLESLFPALDHVRPVNVQSCNLDGALPFIVVNFNNTHRAYPLEQMIMPRHLVHDTLSGSPIAVTYCALCRSGIAYLAEYNNTPLFFRVVGIFRRNLIMEDSVTHTLWQQASGEAVYGPLKGSFLEMLPSYQTPLEKIRNIAHLSIAMEPHNASKPVFGGRVGFNLLKAATNHIITPGKTSLKGLDPRETIFGIQIDGKFRAYPRTMLRQKPGKFFDTINNIKLVLNYDADGDILNIRRNDNGFPPIVEKHWWLGWKEFHPDTSVYEEPPAQHPLK